LYKKSMGRRRSFVTLLLVCSLGIHATACGDDDDDEPSMWAGTCDMRSAPVQTGTCTEWESATRDETGVQSSCEEQGGDWSNEPCPGSGQLGYCSIELEGEFRACFYYDADTNGQAVCLGFCAP
jgi:hypothetical protein